MGNATRAIIFDLDDTLIIERDFARSGYRVVAATFEKQLGPPDRAIAAMERALEGGRRAQVFDDTLSQLGIAADPALLAAMIDCYRTHVPNIRLCDDADRAISRLRLSAALGLISDGRLVTQQNKVIALGLADRLDAIVLTDEWGEAFWKPHPRAYETIAAQLGMPHAACLYVADNPRKDFVAPNALGWQTVQLRRPTSLYIHEPAPVGGAPQRIIASLDELT